MGSWYKPVMTLWQFMVIYFPTANFEKLYWSNVPAKKILIFLLHMISTNFDKFCWAKQIEILSSARII